MGARTAQGLALRAPTCWACLGWWLLVPVRSLARDPVFPIHGPEGEPRRDVCRATCGSAGARQSLVGVGLDCYW